MKYLDFFYTENLKKNDVLRKRRVCITDGRRFKQGRSTSSGSVTGNLQL